MAEKKPKKIAKKAGNSGKRHVPTPTTRVEVSLLASFGTPHTEIGRYIDIDKKTLYKYYRDELDLAKTKAHMQVGNFLYRAASGLALQDKKGAEYRDCLRAAMFYAKTQMGWKEGEDEDEGDGNVVINYHRGKRPDDGA